MLDGSSIAAILTGILALCGALATAWMSGLNERRLESRRNRKALARYSVPLLIASWDLANWLYDILEDKYYSPERCEAYGDGWDPKFTSFLFGQYFAGVHIIREMTQYFAHIRGERAHLLKRLLWKIQDEFISMHYIGRESLEVRWFEGDLLSIQEHMTISTDLDGDGNEAELRTMGWVEFQKNYAAKATADKADKSKELKKVFGWYEDELQSIIYHRFRYLYSTTWEGSDNPQGYEKMRDIITSEKELEVLEKYERDVQKEKQRNPGIITVIPDHRIRRIQHLLVDLTILLDKESGMEFNRPVRRCHMDVGEAVLSHDTVLLAHKDRATALDEGTAVLAYKTPVQPQETREPFRYRILCDCASAECNPSKEDFKHRDLESNRIQNGLVKRATLRYRNSQKQDMDRINSGKRNTEKDNGHQC